MARRPRNKVAALPLSLRRGVAARLLDGCTYAEVVAWLRAEGVDGARLPGNSAFAAYRKGAEYLELRDARLDLERKHEAQRRLSEALKANGTIEDQARMAIYAAMERALTALQSDEVDTAEVLRAVTGVQKVLNETAKLRISQERAARADAPSEERRRIDGDDLADAIERALGLKPEAAA